MEELDVLNINDDDDDDVWKNSVIHKTFMKIVKYIILSEPQSQHPDLTKTQLDPTDHKDPWAM